MTPEQHALAKLKIAYDTRRWEFVEEAIGILDGMTNREPKPEPYRLPDELAPMLKRRALA